MKHYTHGISFFTYSPNSIYLINNHITHPSSQHHQLNKLLMLSIVNQIIWPKHKITIHKIRAHIGNTSIDTTNKLANNHVTIAQPNPTPNIHIAHTTPYWLNKILRCGHKGEIVNLPPYINKKHKNELTKAHTKHTYIKKWVSNDQINHKPSSYFYKALYMMHKH